MGWGGAPAQGWHQGTCRAGGAEAAPRARCSACSWCQQPPAAFLTSIGCPSHSSSSSRRMLDNNRIARIAPAAFAGLRSLYFL